MIGLSTKLYNGEIKEKYLNEKFSNEDSKKTIRTLFGSAELIEDVLEKDLYNFNLVEIGKVIQNAKPHSFQVAKAYGQFISNYISWAIKPMALRENNINPMKGIDTSWYSQFVDNSKKIHWSKKEFIEFLESLSNAQDQAFLALLFEGVMGASHSELVNITYEDIDWTNQTIKIKERDKNNEIVKLDDTFMRFIKNAYNEQTYRSYHVETGDYKERDLISSDYLFKNAISKRLKDPKSVAASVLYSRLKHIKEEHDLEYLTPNAIRQSGMINMAVELYLDKNAKLTYEDFEKIGDKYSYSKIKTPEYEYYNTTLMKQIIDIDKVYDLTGVKIEY